MSTTHRVLVGDCVKHLREMPTNSVDLVFTSPPYEDVRSYSIGFKLTGQAWVSWCVERYLECVRVCRGLVCWVVEGKTHERRWSATPAMLMADLHRAGVMLRKPPIFHRIGIPGSGGPDWWRNDYEFIVCSSKGPLPWSDNTATGHPPKWAPGGAMSHRLSNGARRNQWGGGPNPIGARRRNGSRQIGKRPSHIVQANGEVNGLVKHREKRLADGSKQSQVYRPPTLANPGNVLHLKVGGGLMGHPLAHENEAPFPESLVDPFVCSFCPPEGTVLDPFCGSGTTLAVAKKRGRHSIGIDLRKSQRILTEKRLAEVEFQSTLFERKASR